jgi:hypothetical protein
VNDLLRRRKEGQKEKQKEMKEDRKTFYRYRQKVVPSSRVSGSFFPSVSGRKSVKIPAKIEVAPKITIAASWLCRPCKQQNELMSFDALSRSLKILCRYGFWRFYNDLNEEEIQGWNKIEPNDNLKRISKTQKRVYQSVVPYIQNFPKIKNYIIN